MGGWDFLQFLHDFLKQCSSAIIMGCTQVFHTRWNNISWYIDRYCWALVSERNQEHIIVLVGICVFRARRVKHSVSNGTFHPQLITIFHTITNIAVAPPLLFTLYPIARPLTFLGFVLMFNNLCYMIMMFNKSQKGINDCTRCRNLQGFYPELIKVLHFFTTNVREYFALISGIMAGCNIGCRFFDHRVQNKVRIKIFKVHKVDGKFTTLTIHKYSIFQII